ncbi:MAG: prolipoprotein diacylglyceryl transferase, partial [Clostridia bacterium]|nr:prolipoprotein diacylglyceryl transferase [Clostridia bacterium]
MVAATPVSRFAAGSLTWYSVLIALSVLLSYIMVIREEKRRLLPVNTAADAFIYFIPTGIIGARLYYVVFSLSQFALNPIRALFIWEGGLAIYGAIIGGIAGVYLYARRKRLSLALLMDMYAPFLALSQAIGRWGNYFNQEAYGYSVSNPRLMFFPAAVLIATGDIPQWHYATFFYESIWNLFVFCVLLR